MTTSTRITLFFILASAVLIILFISLYHNTVDEYFDGESVLYAKPFPVKFVFKHIISADWLYFRPLALFQWKVESYLFGKNHRYYHYTLMAMNIINIVLVFILGYLILGSRLSAFIAGLLFTLHPAHGEVVSFLWSKFDVLVGIFYMFSMILFLKSLDFKREMESQDGGFYVLKYWSAVVISYISFILALSSKEMAVTLPPVIFIFVFLKKLDLGFLKSIKTAFKHTCIHFAILIIFLIFLVVRGSPSSYTSNFISQIPNMMSNVMGHLEVLFIPGFIALFLFLALFFRDKIYIFTLIFTFLSIAPLIHMVSEHRFVFVPTIGYSLAVAWLLTKGIERLFDLMSKLGFLRKKASFLKIGQYCIMGIAILSLTCYLWAESKKNLNYWHNVQYERNYVPMVIESCPTLPEGLILYFADNGYEPDAPPDEIMLSFSGELLFHYGDKIRALSLIRYFYPKVSPVFMELDKSYILELRDGKFVKRNDLMIKTFMLSRKFGIQSYGSENVIIEGNIPKDTRGGFIRYVCGNLDYPGFRFGRIEVELESEGLLQNDMSVKLGFQNEEIYEYHMVKDNNGSNLNYHLDLYTNINWILQEKIGRIYFKIENGNSVNLKKVILKTPPPIFFDMLGLQFPWMK